jgi:uncharacterized protein YbcI
MPALEQRPWLPYNPTRDSSLTPAEAQFMPSQAPVVPRTPDGRDQMPPDETDADISQLAQISRAIMRVYKDKIGRGPDRVRCHYAGPDAIVCFLEGTLTPLERLLTTIDEHQRLRDVRLLAQDVSRAELCAAVERATGRAVIACTSGFDSRADVASESFQLAQLD